MSFVKLVIFCSVFSENPFAAIVEYIAFISSITYARLGTTHLGSVSACKFTKNNSRTNKLSKKR